MKELSAKQFYYILILSMLSLKFMALPSLLYSSAGPDGYLVVAFALIIEFFFFWLFMDLTTKYPNLKFNELLEKKFGVVFSKIIFVFIGLYFLFKSITAIEGVHAFFKENLFEELETIIFIVPMFSIIIYMVVKGLNCFGRTLEVLFYIIATAIILAIALAVFSLDFQNLFPFLKNGFTPILESYFTYNFWFGDFLILTLFMGRVKQSNNFKKNSLLIWIFTSIFIVFFVILFICLFGNIAPYHRLAIADIAQYSFNFISTLQIDWLPILLWTLGLFYQCALGFWLTTQAFVNVATQKAKIYILGALSIIAIAVLQSINFNINQIVYFCSNYFNYFSIILTILVLVLGLLCLKKPKRRVENDKVFQKNF